MRRYIPSRRTRSNTIDTSALRDQFIRQLTNEANVLLLKLSGEFSETLQAQIAQATQAIVAGDGQNVAANTTGAPGTIGSIGQLLATGARFLVSRPKTSRNSQESSRSIAATTQFRLSNAQAAAEAQSALNKGEKNR